ncbi:MAG TPA: sigma-70 family RNA polymerase sigma factor [Planctomycetota bacterium]|nr:sigma-70 family RNA polymerase sigma factor [Planctomycetota bacterium]
MDDFTMLLEQAGNGDPAAGERLAERLYSELRALARREMAGERPDHTLQPTALVHEAYLRLMGVGEERFESRAHFYGAAARAIRRVLVDHARSRRRLKRGAGGVRIELDGLELQAPERDARLVALDDALERLAELDPRKARLVELRFFAGMTLEQAASALGASPSTVARDWRTARAWLQSELDGGEPGSGDGR